MLKIDDYLQGISFILTIITIVDGLIQGYHTYQLILNILVIIVLIITYVRYAVKRQLN